MNTMKNHLRAIPLHMLLLAGIIPALPAAAAAAPKGKPEAAPPPSAKVAPPRPAAEKIAFLGVHTERVDDAARRRLKLAADTGLRVHLVAPDSPAHGKLQPGDVLTLLDSQILCNHEQFSALVRARKPGDTITLKFHRDGEASEVKIVLGTAAARDLPLVPEVRLRIHGRDVPLGEFLHDEITRLHGGVITINPDAFSGIPDEVREHLRELQAETRRRAEEWFGKKRAQPEKQDGKTAPADTAPDGKPGAKRGRIEVIPENSGENSPAQGSVSKKFSDTQSEILVTDHEGTARLSFRNGLCCLKMQDAAGKVIFDGPVDTPARRAALPKNIAKKLETIEQIADIGVSINGTAPGPEETSEEERDGDESFSRI